MIIFEYSESPDRAPERAGLGGGVHPDHVRARDEPDRADPARPLAAQARPDALTRLRGPSGGAPVHHSVTGSSQPRSPRAAPRVEACRRVAWETPGQGEEHDEEGTRPSRSRGRSRCSLRPAPVQGTPRRPSRARAARSSRRSSRCGRRRSERRSTTRSSTAPIGSGGGIQAITNRTVDFGASDAPLTADQFAACNGCVQIPWALAGTAIPYNVPGITPAKAAAHLQLSGDVIAKIYMGQITNWNDPAIKKLNPKATMPDLKITPGLPHRQLGHDLQLHRLPLGGQPDLEVVSSARASRSPGRPEPARAAPPASPASSRTRRAPSATSTPRSRSRTTFTSRPIQNARASSSTRASATSPRRATP